MIVIVVSGPITFVAKALKGSHN